VSAVLQVAAPSRPMTRRRLAGSRPRDRGAAVKEETLAQRRIFDGKIVGLRVDTVRLPNGRTATREIVEHRPAVAIVPVADDGRLLLVRQWRSPTDRALLEVPAGVADEGEEPDAAVQRELQEEIG